LDFQLLLSRLRGAKPSFIRIPLEGPLVPDSFALMQQPLPLNTAFYPLVYRRAKTVTWLSGMRPIPVERLPIILKNERL
jgi:hypothetical protein